MSHYFINDNSEKREYERDVELFSRRFVFNTSDGVFAKSGVDAGSAYLLQAALPCMELEKPDVADLGCGYGVIGVVVAAMKPGARCVLIDVNVKAAELANANAVRNGAGERVKALVSDGLRGLGMESAMDYILTNPPFRAGKQTVIRFFKESHETLRPGGSLFAVLRKQQGAESYQRAISDIFGNCAAILKKKGYVVIKAVKANGDN